MNKKVLYGAIAFLVVAIGLGVYFYMTMTVNPKAALTKALDSVKSGTLKQLDGTMAMKMEVQGMKIDIKMDIKADLDAKKLYTAQEMTFLGQTQKSESMCYNDKFYVKSTETEDKWLEVTEEELSSYGSSLTSCDLTKEVSDTTSLTGGLTPEFKSYEEKTVGGKTLLVYKIDSTQADELFKKAMEKSSAGATSSDVKVENGTVVINVDKSTQELVSIVMTFDMTGDFGGQQMTVKGVEINVQYNSVNKSLTFPDPTK